MAVDTPARIAIIGAGPIGLEAALYARFLGYDVDVLERGRVGENILRWGHVKLFTPFKMNRSPLGMAALTAQNPQQKWPDDNALLTGREYVEHYVLPLAQSDLLIDHVQEQTEVLAIGRKRQTKQDHAGQQKREDDDFCLLIRQGKRERLLQADVVIDASGVFAQPNWLGRGGLPAVGELRAAHGVEYGLPDILGTALADYAGKRVLVVGAGYSAATNLVQLAAVARQHPATHITWITRQATASPLPRIPDDRLPERDQLATAANTLAAGSESFVQHWPRTTVTGIKRNRETGAFQIRLAGEHRGKMEVDRVVANVGYRPQLELYRELQVHQCYASEGPMKLAAALMGQTSADCLTQTACGPQTLLTSEPDFYILGAKSYGRNSQFLLSVGLAQIRELFTVIGDRADLDLYFTIGQAHL